MANNAQIETHVRRVGDVLRDYAGRRVFRSISEGERRAGKTTFSMVWHHGRTFRFVLDCTARKVSFPGLLPGVPPRSSMARELKAFLGQFQTDQVPPHRRIDSRKAALRILVRGNNVSVALIVKNNEFEYSTRRLVHLAQEVYMVFLPDGPYSDYRIETLGLDPDNVWV
jgi:hypothetical protein